MHLIKFHLIFKIHFNIIFPSPHSALPCVTYVINLIILVVLLHGSIYKAPHLVVFSSPLTFDSSFGPNIPPTTIFSYILNLFHP